MAEAASAATRVERRVGVNPGEAPTGHPDTKVVALWAAVIAVGFFQLRFDFD